MKCSYPASPSLLAPSHDVLPSAQTGIAYQKLTSSVEKCDAALSAAAPPSAPPAPTESIETPGVTTAENGPSRRRKRPAPETTRAKFHSDKNMNKNKENIDPQTGRIPTSAVSSRPQQEQQQRQQVRQPILKISRRSPAARLEAGADGAPPPRKRHTSDRRSRASRSVLACAATAAAAAAAAAACASVGDFGAGSAAAAVKDQGSRQPLRTLWTPDEKSFGNRVLGGRPPMTNFCLTALRTMR